MHTTTNILDTLHTPTFINEALHLATIKISLKMTLIALWQYASVAEPCLLTVRLFYLCFLLKLPTHVKQQTTGHILNN